MVFAKATIAGAPLCWTWNNETNTYQALTNRDWEKLVLQPYDRMLYDPKPTNHPAPTFDWGDITNAVNFIKFALTANPDIRVYVYSHWPGVTNYDRHEQYVIKGYTYEEAEVLRQQAIAAYDFDTSWNAIYTNSSGYIYNRSRSYFELLVRELEKQNLTNSRA